MDEEGIHRLFLKFASPLSRLVTLGGRQEAASELARNLWMAMIGGAAVEEELWSAMASSNSQLTETLQQLYEKAMKPLVSDQELADLRAHYGVQPDSE